MTNPHYTGQTKRLHWAISPTALINLLAILPSIISTSALNLRILRDLHLLRLFRLGHYSHDFNIFIQMLHKSRQQLMITLTAILIILLISSSILYMVERKAQPITFGSVPTTMW